MTNLEKQLLEESKTKIYYQHYRCVITGEMCSLRHVIFLDDSKEAQEIFKRSYEHIVGEYILTKTDDGRKVVTSRIEGPRQS